MCILLQVRAELSLFIGTELTPRERDVVRLAVEGMRNQEISARLSVSEHTVRNYLFRTF